LVAYLAGFGPIAIPGPHFGFWIYLVGPSVGAIVGGLLYEQAVASHLEVHPTEEERLDDISSVSFRDSNEQALSRSPSMEVLAEGDGHHE